jgi:outer membrane protein TolC
MDPSPFHPAIQNLKFQEILMKQWLQSGLCLLCLLPILVWGQTPAAPVVLTLNDAISTAVAHNRTLLLSQQGVTRAAGRVTEVKGAGNVQANFSANADYFHPEEDIPLAVGIDSQQHLIFATLPYVPAEEAITAFGVSKVIDISGRIKTGTQLAELGEQSATLNVARTRNDVVLQTKASYYTVLRTQELVAVAQEAQQNAQLRRKTAQSLVDAGVTGKIDIYHADASVAATQQSVISAQNAVEISKATLNNILGRDVNTPFDIQTPTEQVGSLAAYTTYLREAEANRPEVAIASTNYLSAEASRQLAKDGKRPNLVLNASAGYEMADKIPGEPIETITGAFVFPIDDGGQTRGRIVQANADIASAQVSKSDTQARIALEVKSAYVNLQNAGEKLNAAQKELDQASENLRLAQLRYEQGIANQLEVSDAELLKTQAQTNVVNAHYDQLTSQAVLEQAMGRYQK